MRKKIGKDIRRSPSGQASRLAASGPIPAGRTGVGCVRVVQHDYAGADPARQAKCASLSANDLRMATPRVLILRAPGANCDAEAQFAFEKAGALAERVHINRLREQPSQLMRYQILAIPGGFTYGDDVA